VLAKGAKKPKSSFGGALDLFYLGDALVIRRPRSGLHLLAAFHVRDSFPPLRAALPRFYAACHLAEILTGMTREEEPQPELFDLIADGIRRLSDAAPDEVPSLLAAIELRTLAHLGFAPALEGCAGCGRRDLGRAPAISVAIGGVVCPECGSRDPKARRVAPGVLGALRALGRGPGDHARRIRLSPADRRAIRAFLNAFVEWRLERALRTSRFLG